MTLRKLSIILLLLAAQFATFAQSADLASGSNPTTFSSSKSVEKTEKNAPKPALKPASDSTKKTTTVPTKTTVETSKKNPITSAKPTVDSTKKTGTTTAKIVTDSVKKVAIVPAKTPNKTGVDSIKKVVLTPAKTVVDSTKKAVMSASKTAIPSIFGGPTNGKSTPSVLKKKETVRPSFNAVTDKASVRNATLLNGDKDDFSPIAFENGLLFCSNSKKMAKKTDKATIIDDLNLKFSIIDSFGNLTKPTAFARKTNSKTHEGPSCFSVNGDTMFLTRVMSKGGIAKTNKEGETTLKIYIKIRDKDGGFSGDAVMPFESETYSYCHPTISADGQRLYFSSNMPGGFGGMDLWMTRKLKNGNWSQAMNLGSRINSKGNELFPNITTTGAFYFSSNGRKGNKGGLDIYTVDIDNKIAQAAALGEAFNTEGDDFGIMFLPTNDHKGYFSSNRKGGSGGDDIYEFEFK